jgi:phosphoribosylformylglycinamidine synthase I
VTQIRVLIVRAAGTNCDRETEHAWARAGAAADRVHLRRLIDAPAEFDRYQVLTVPGGFSFGDDIAAGRILAAQMRRHLADALRAFVDQGKLVLGICNGFQVLIQLGLLPGVTQPGETRSCTIAGNQPPGFQDRWVYLRARGDRCVFLEPDRVYEMPIAHGEGRVTFTTPADCQRVVAAGHGVLAYADPPDGSPNNHGTPSNPNGSAADLAGLCDATGRVLGLMPHPERFVRWTQHPRWTAQPARPEGDGLALFRAAVRALA